MYASQNVMSSLELRSLCSSTFVRVNLVRWMAYPRVLHATLQELVKDRDRYYSMADRRMTKPCIGPDEASMNDLMVQIEAIF